MLPWLGERVGNPSGAHKLARAARRAVDDARDVFAAATGMPPGDVVFTGGGTEADNLAIAGILDRHGGRAVTVATEHHAVLEPIEAREGAVVGVDHRGIVDQDRLIGALGDDVTLVSVMTVNNETGVRQPMADLVATIRSHAPNARIHTDAVQAFSWLDLPSVIGDVDLVSLSAHKFGGPQGVGVLAMRSDVTLAPQLIGGGQERGRRSGTQNVAGIVGAAAAAAVTMADHDHHNRRLGAIRDRLVDGILAVVPGAIETGVVDGDRSHKVAGNAHLCFPGVEAEALLVLLEDADVYASAAASCASGAQEPSHVLAAMGVDRSVAAGSLRLSLGWSTTDHDIDTALGAVPAAVERMRIFSGAS